MTSEQFTISSIGYIKSNFSEPSDPFEMKKSKSSLVLFSQYKDGIYDLKVGDYINVIFYFHLLDSKRYDNLEMKTINYFGEEKGVFACCTPYRPSKLALTEVQIIKINANTLDVSGLDAVDGSPIIDIKPSFKNKSEQ